MIGYILLIVSLSLTNLISCEEDSCICTINSEEETADCSYKYLRTIPACVPNTTKILLLKNNHLRHSPNQFKRFKYLTYLDISFNYGFQPDKFSFAGLSELKNLYLAGNGIHTISRSMFTGLHKLQILSMSQNRLTKISNYQLSELSNLTHLYLDDCVDLKHLYNHSFSELYQLRYLSLNYTFLTSTIETIDLDTFQPLTNLEELHLVGWCNSISRIKFGYYNCSNIDKILSRVPSLKRLHLLDEILVHKLGPGFALLKNLEELYFHRLPAAGVASIILTNQTFNILNNAKISKLLIDQTVIRTLLPNTFASLKYLTSLDMILRTAYTCSDVYENFGIGLNNTKIQHIKLSVVQCQDEITVRLEKCGLKKTQLVSLDLSHGSISSLGNSFFADLPSSLQYLYLNHNQIDSIDTVALSELKYLTLVIWDLSNQPLLGNEQDNISTNSNVTYLTLPQLQAQYSSTDGDCYVLPYSLKYIDISNSNLLLFFFYLYNICEPNNSLRSLKASYQIVLGRFDRFWNSLRNLPMLEELDLSGNRISYIPSWAFSHHNNLKSLSLSDNAILIITFEIQSSELNYLDLSYNSIRYLSTLFANNMEHIAENSNLTVDLGKNQLVCDCERIKFAAWLEKTDVIYKKDELKCKYENGTETQLSNIKDIYNSLAVQCIVFDVTIACIVGFVALNILLGLIALIWHRRWQMRYLFSVARQNVSPYHPIENQEIQLEYDVYISYERDFNVTVNESLHQFVASKVYPALQRRGFNVLIRDELDIGKKMYDVISRAIRRCKKVVVFLSRDYCGDYWNVFEFNLAVMEGIYTKRQVVIPVAFENLRRIDLHDEVYAYLNIEPVPRYRNDMSDTRLIDYLSERIKDDRNIE